MDFLLIVFLIPLGTVLGSLGSLCKRLFGFSQGCYWFISFQNSKCSMITSLMLPGDVGASMSLSTTGFILFLRIESLCLNSLYIGFQPLGFTTCNGVGMSFTSTSSSFKIGCCFSQGKVGVGMEFTSSSTFKIGCCFS